MSTSLAPPCFCSLMVNSPGTSPIRKAPTSALTQTQHLADLQESTQVCREPAVWRCSNSRMAATRLRRWFCTSDRILGHQLPVRRIGDVDERRSQRQVWSEPPAPQLEHVPGPVQGQLLHQRATDQFDGYGG